MAAPVTPFIHELRFADLPGPVVHMAKRCVLDLAGVAAAGTRTPMSQLARDHAARHLAAGQGAATAPLMYDGRTASPIGAAFAGAATIDSFDAHDGHVLTKGHAGVAVLPAALALAGPAGVAGGEFLTRIVLGYEVATRAGMALHATASDYHTSGAWNALACAALGARALGLDSERTRHALGLAEFHGPRSPMMRCIDHPTMVKDGSAWGALAGVSAALLAGDGFSGAPALLAEDPAVTDLWADLGSRWRILEQYFKPYPVCRWAQPAVEAALMLQRETGVTASDIAQVTVITFHEAKRLAASRPSTTEEAQYSLPHSVASALVRGRLGAGEITGGGLDDPAVRRLGVSMKVEESEDYNRLFPAERWAEVAFTLADGTVLTSAPAVARGNPENPLSDAEIAAKFHDLAAPVLGPERAARIVAAVSGLENGAAPLVAELTSPVASV